MNQIGIEFGCPTLEFPWPGNTQIQQSRERDPFSAPLADSRGRDAAESGHGDGSAEFINEERVDVSHSHHFNHSYNENANHSSSRPCNHGYMETLAERLRRLRVEHGLTMSDVARRVGVSTVAVHKWETGQTANMKLANFERLCELYGIDFDELLHGNDGNKTNVKDVDRSPVPMAVMDSGAAEYLSNAIPVPVLANAASMGAGSELLSEDVVAGTLLLTRSFVLYRVQPSSPSALRFLHAYGDSMSPTLNSGDIVLVDTGINAIDIDGIYVLEAHDRLFIKRVRQRIDGRYEISSVQPS